MVSVSKKRKVADECRTFQDRWTEQYFFIVRGNKSICLICSDSVSVKKEFNLQRHSTTKHGEYAKLTGQERKYKLHCLHLSLQKQQCIFTRQNEESENNTQVSYIVSNLIAQHMKPFSDGEFLKTVLRQ